MSLVSALIGSALLCAPSIGEPMANFTPTLIEFEALAVNDTLSQTVVVRNAGAATLQVDDITVVNEAEVFVVEPTSFSVGV